MLKYSFLNDYSEGAHPQLLKSILDTNMEQHVPYGDDAFSSKAKELIIAKIGFGEPDIFFVPTGTQANLIIISSALKSHESVISVNTGHITIREAGAIEATGHKINTVYKASGKLASEDVIEVLKQHDFGPHTVKPKMVYISNTTEIGTIYTKFELEALSKFCKEHGLLLFLDGARLGSALTASNNDLTLTDIARLTDIFTIGGTKSGALIGEAIVINNNKLKEHFPFHIKQRGAMLAKGRLIGVQFIELFRDNLFFDLAKHANVMAEKISQAVKSNGFNMLTDSTSNQLFPILPNELVVELEKKFEFYRWAEFDNEHATLRLVTSWATQEEKVNTFINTMNTHSIINNKKGITMTKKITYQNNLNIEFEHSQVIDMDKIVETNTHEWLNQTLTQVNDSVIRIGIIEGDYHWHKHEDEDEFFYVISGTLFIDLEDDVIKLEPNQAVTISKNMMHRTRAPKKVTMLMVETKDIIPTGD